MDDSDFEYNYSANGTGFESDHFNSASESEGLDSEEEDALIGQIYFRSIPRASTSQTPSHRLDSDQRSTPAPADTELNLNPASPVSPTDPESSTKLLPTPKSVLNQTNGGGDNDDDDDDDVPPSDGNANSSDYASDTNAPGEYLMEQSITLDVDAEMRMEPPQKKRKPSGDDDGSETDPANADYTMEFDAPVANCNVCGSHKHTAANCPHSGTTCSRCMDRGHLAAKCNNDRVRPKNCPRCRRPIHLEQNCPTLWRKFTFKPTITPAVLSDLARQYRNRSFNVPIFCYRCGRAGHFGDDCDAPEPRDSSGMARRDTMVFNYDEYTSFNDHALWSLAFKQAPGSTYHRSSSDSSHRPQSYRSSASNGRRPYPEPSNQRSTAASRSTSNSTSNSNSNWNSNGNSKSNSYSNAKSNSTPTPSSSSIKGGSQSDRRGTQSYPSKKRGRSDLPASSNRNCGNEQKKPPGNKKPSGPSKPTSGPPPSKKTKPNQPEFAFQFGTLPDGKSENNNRGRPKGGAPATTAGKDKGTFQFKGAAAAEAAAVAAAAAATTTNANGSSKS